MVDLIGKKQLGGFVIPSALPDEIGFGCPKCDDAVFVAPTARPEELAKFIQGFLKKHRSCGDLECLEKRRGQLLITGKLKKGF